MKKLFIFLLLSVMLISNVMSVPPVTTVAQFPAGYTIVESQQITLTAGKNFTYHFFVLNTSNGKGVSNNSINCTFVLADSQGNILSIITPKWNVSKFWNVDIDGNNFTKTGVYKYGLRCEDGAGGALTGSLEVTPKGETKAGEITIIFFIIIFLAVIAGMLSLLLLTIFHFINLDFSMKHLIINLSSYFGIFAYYILEQHYLGNKFIDDFMLFLIDVGSIATVILPIIAFFVVFIKERMENKKGDKSYS